MAVHLLSLPRQNFRSREVVPLKWGSLRGAMERLRVAMKGFKPSKVGDVVGQGHH